MKSQKGTWSTILIIFIMSLIVLISGCTSNNDQAQQQNTTTAIESPSRLDNLSSSPNESSPSQDNLSSSPIVENTNVTVIQNTKPYPISLTSALGPIVYYDNSEYNNNITASGTIKQTSTGYDVNIKFTNTGGTVFGFNCAQAILENGRGSGSVVNMYHDNYTYKDGTNYFYVRLERGDTFNEQFNISTNIKQLQQSSSTGKLGLHIVLYEIYSSTDIIFPGSGTSSKEPTSQDEVAIFHAAIPKSIGTTENHLTFTDFATNRDKVV